MLIPERTLEANEEEVEEVEVESDDDDAEEDDDDADAEVAVLASVESQCSFSIFGGVKNDVLRLMWRNGDERRTGGRAEGRWKALAVMADDGFIVDDVGDGIEAAEARPFVARGRDASWVRMPGCREGSSLASGGSGSGECVSREGGERRGKKRNDWKRSFFLRFFFCSTANLGLFSSFVEEEAEARAIDFDRPLPFSRAPSPHQLTRAPAPDPLVAYPQAPPRSMSPSLSLRAAPSSARGARQRRMRSRGSSSSKSSSSSQALLPPVGATSGQRSSQAAPVAVVADPKATLLNDAEFILNAHEKVKTKWRAKEGGKRGDRKGASRFRRKNF